MADNLAEIALPLATWTRLSVPETVGMECSRAIITVDELARLRTYAAQNEPFIGVAPTFRLITDTGPALLSHDITTWAIKK